ncbi:MAG: efflux RND transporter permease subunit [Elusimicrobia bacterium]|nr:efflux RND transporter permease subunit [Elusimicrobiota bacterium]
MSISDVSIRNPVFAWMLMLGLMFFGWLGFSRMGVSLMPDVDFPVLSISLSWEGAAPEIMETEVVDLVEDAMTSVEGVREISSSSRQGSASVTVEFELDRNIDVALQDVQAKLAQLQRRLPRDLDPAVVSKSNPEDNPIMWLALSGTLPLKDMMVLMETRVKQQFQTIPGVGEVHLGGLVDRNLRVWLDAEAMQAKQITAQDVLAAIGREHVEVPAGRLETAAREFNVRALGEFPSAEEFAGLLITQRGGAPIHVPIKLKEVARIEDGLGDTRRIARANGVRAIGMGIRKQRGANSVKVAAEVTRRLFEVRKTLRPEVELNVNFDSTRFIKDAVHELNFNLILSALLTSVVCWLFLGTWSSTANILMAIPTSILGTFIATYFLGFTLNSFSMLGLTLAIGIVVDDAIMVLENIVRHRELGKDRVRASVEGAREITFAAMAATLAILAIFVPVVFMKGIVGKFFFQFGVTISVAVMLSLLEALTLTPMRTSQFLAEGRASGMARLANDLFGRLSRVYGGVLAACLDHRWKTLALAAAFFGGTLLLARGLRWEFVPPQDQSMFMLRLRTPVGSSIEATDAKFQEIGRWLTAQPAVRRYFGNVGGMGGGEVSTGMMFVTMKPPEERPKGPGGQRVTQGDFIREARKELKKIPGVSAIPLDLSQAGFGANRGMPIEFSVRGPDWEKLVGLSKTLLASCEATGLMVDVDSDYRAGMPEVRVYPDRAKAYARGVSVESVGTVINAMVGGVRAGYFTDAGRRYEVRVRAATGYRLKASDIGKFFVRNNRGEMIRLAEVVRIEERSTLLSILRKDRERAIGITANVAPGKSQADAIAAVERLSREGLPPGYHVVFGGSARTFRESFESLLLVLGLGLIVAYMVLGSQFNSFLHPFTVLLALPFSVSGALLALRATDTSLNLYSMIGIILLMGIVKKNSILLVDFTNQRRAGGLPVRDALLEACPVRLRPILMTSISTIAAALPPALALGPGAETRIPMAVTVIGGVAVSTFLTLFVVPCAYSLLARLERRATTALSPSATCLPAGEASDCAAS